VTWSGRFVNAAPERVEAVLRVVSLDVVQFQGDETARGA
jgi:hypothetical protein